MVKGAVHPVMALVITGVVIFIGIYAVTQVITSTASATTAKKVLGESIVLANNTAKLYTTQATCLGDYPEPASCGVESGGITYLYNTTNTVPESEVGGVSYTYNSSTITAIFNDTFKAGTWYLNYTYYDYVSSGADVNYPTIQSTFWNSMQLAAVSLITVAASLVLGSFFFK